MIESDRTNDDRSARDLDALLEQAKLAKEVALTEKLIAETRLMQTKTRWRPLLLLSYAMWAVALVLWAVVSLGFLEQP